MPRHLAQNLARYTPRFLAAVKQRYEGTDQPMPQIAFHYGISLRTLHRMVEREGWRKRGDRPPKDLTSSELLAQATEALQRGDNAAFETLLRESQEMLKRQQQSRQ